MKEFDLIVIGAGPGGYVAAIKAAKAGLRTAIIENLRVGGTCLNRGCIPAKAMIHATSLYRETVMGERFGINAPDAAFDYEEILRYKQDTIDGLVGGIEQLLSGNGVTIIDGSARLEEPEDGKNRVFVTPERLMYTAKYVILATGSRPAGLPVPGSDLMHVLDSDGLFELDDAPQSLLIIGGGVIGVEFATVFSNLGTEVTIVEALPKLLDNFDKEISQNLKMILKKRGVDTHLNASVQEILPSDDDWVVCRFEEKGKEQEIAAEYILVATGRRPVIDGLFAECLQPEMNGKFVAVDEAFRTSLENVYAIGDLTGGIQLAHAASAHGIRAVEEILRAEGKLNAEGDGPAFAQDLSLIPGGVYTDPEIATIGLTEVQAREQGIPAACGKFIMSANGKSMITKEERGFIKVVAHKESHEILGCQMMCARATDMIEEFTTAILNHLTVEDMLRGIRPHPTYNEGVSEALEDVFGESLHTVPKRRR